MEGEDDQTNHLLNKKKIKLSTLLFYLCFLRSVLHCYSPLLSSVYRAKNNNFLQQFIILSKRYCKKKFFPAFSSNFVLLTNIEYLLEKPKKESSYLCNE